MPLYLRSETRSIWWYHKNHSNSITYTNYANEWNQISGICAQQVTHNWTEQPNNKRSLNSITLIISPFKFHFSIDMKSTAFICVSIAFEIFVVSLVYKSFGTIEIKIDDHWQFRHCQRWKICLIGATPISKLINMKLTSS